MPALGWLALYYHRDYRDPEPKKVIAQTFLAGAAVGLPFLLLRYSILWLNLDSLIFQGITTVVIFAALEEMAKLSAAIFVVTKNKLAFNQVIDGVVYAVVAALGFAFLENTFYISSFFANTESTNLLVYMIAFRSLGTMLAHTLFSGTAGLIWAYAHFSKQITPFQKKHLLAFEVKDFVNREILSLHIIRQNILKARPSRRGGHEEKVLVLEGIILATLFHALFNIMTTFEILGKNLTFLLVPAVMGGLMYFSYLFTKRVNTKILKVV